MRHTFQASETPIRCLAMDPEEEYFVTGSAEGDIKVRIRIFEFRFEKVYDDQDPVVQSIVSLKILLRHKFVKQISAKVTNTLLFFVEKI